MFYVNIFKVKEWTCPFFILAVNTGNDVSTFGGSASIVSDMRPV